MLSKSPLTECFTVSMAILCSLQNNIFSNVLCLYYVHFQNSPCEWTVTSEINESKLVIWITALLWKLLLHRKWINSFWPTRLENSIELWSKMLTILFLLKHLCGQSCLKALFSWSFFISLSVPLHHLLLSPTILSSLSAISIYCSSLSSSSISLFTLPICNSIRQQW